MDNNLIDKVIFGWFFDPAEECKPYIVSPEIATFEGQSIENVNGIFQVNFSGIVKINQGAINGRLLDYYGLSTINGEISENYLSFEKRYETRKKDVVKYEFTRQGDLWIGRFKERTSYLSQDIVYNGQIAQVQFANIIQSNREQRKLILPEVKNGFV